ncbi:hypothetical protein [Mesorhizobium xinjiangense]|nr:hypothetical protein [Mesorhizobium xinjiangense]
MMNEQGGMMDGMSGLAMWGMSFLWMLVVVFLVLGVVALIKYFFF